MKTGEHGRGAHGSAGRDERMGGMGGHVVAPHVN